MSESDFNQARRLAQWFLAIVSLGGIAVMGTVLHFHQVPMLWTWLIGASVILTLAVVGYDTLQAIDESGEVVREVRSDG